MFLKIDQQLERCARVMRQRVAPYIHTTLSEPKVRSYTILGEPISSQDFFDQLEHGEITFNDFQIGSVWGTTWGTVWFEITGHIDTSNSGQQPTGEENSSSNLNSLSSRQELVIDLGWYDHSVGGHIEGLVYRPDGTVIKAIHPRNSWVPLVDDDGHIDPAIREDGSFTLYLEAASNPLLLGVPAFVETELGECATGKPDEPYVFRSISVGVFNPEVFEYYQDLEVVSSLITNLNDNSPRYWQLAKALQQSLNTYDERNVVGTIGQARDELSEVLAKRANASSLNVSAMGHAHIDSAWLWPVRETRRKVARTVSNVLALMNDNPDMTYAMSSAQQYVWLEKEHPDLFERMLQRIREGRFIPVGGMWVESDGMLPSGESLVRQLTFGRRYFQEHLGVVPRGVWLPDSFGYTCAWPQIARRAGCDWFLTQKISWNDTTKFPHHSFYWESIDGSRIFTHFPPADTYASEMTTRELMYTEKNFKNKDFSDRVLMLYGYGDGGGGPTREMLSRLDRFKSLESVPRVNHAHPDDFFDAAREQIEANCQASHDEFPSYRGELYLERHRATLTAQSEMKRGCRTTELMLRMVEYLASYASLLNKDYRYPVELLNQVWQTLLLNQFHDILPGSAIAWVHRVAREDYKRSYKVLCLLAQESWDALKSVCSGDGNASRNGDASAGEANQKHSSPVVKFNQYSRETGGMCLKIAGNAQDSKVQLITLEDGSIELSNARVKAIIAANGEITSLFDLKRNREVIPDSCSLGVYQLLKDEPYIWDAWDIDREALQQVTELHSAHLVETSVHSDAVSATFKTTWNRPDKAGEMVESSIVTTISLKSDAASLDFHAEVDWHERERFLKVALPLDLLALNAEYETQYGLIERSIVKNTETHDAQFENCTQRFVRIHDGDYTVAVVNNHTYGSDAMPLRSNDGRVGTMLRLSLLSSPLFPDPRTDIGHHSYDWSIVLDADLPTTLEQAARLTSLDLPELDSSLLEISDATIKPLITLDIEEGMPVIDWVKLADDGSGDVIVRIYEAAGGRASARLNVHEVLHGCRVHEVNLMEDDEVSSDLTVALAAPCNVEDAKLHFRPFELATLRFSRNAEVTK